MLIAAALIGCAGEEVESADAPDEVVASDTEALAQATCVTVRRGVLGNVHDAWNGPGPLAGPLDLIGMLELLTCCTQLGGPPSPRGRGATARQAETRAGKLHADWATSEKQRSRRPGC